MDNCIFCKIINKQIPSTILYEDTKTIVINDIHPAAPIHLLIIPKKHIKDFYDLDSQTGEAITKTLQAMIDKEILMGKGYKIEVNGGGAQIVNHLHFHLKAPVGKP